MLVRWGKLIFFEEGQALRMSDGGRNWTRGTFGWNVRSSHLRAGILMKNIAGEVRGSLEAKRKKRGIIRAARDLDV
jgi:hypothetical protein